MIYPSQTNYVNEINFHNKKLQEIVKLLSLIKKNKYLVVTSVRKYGCLAQILTERM